MTLPKCSCGAVLEADTDLNGKVIFWHSGKCVPKIQRYPVSCSICSKAFEIAQRPKRNAEYGCSDACLAMLKTKHSSAKAVAEFCDWLKTA